MEKNIEKLFIDKEIFVLKGIEAENNIREKNDSKYIENDAILKVDKERWLDAQYYEKKTWMELNRYATDDRNNEHFQRFDGYLKLKENNKPIKRVIELGCGPFTNLRTLYTLLPNLEEIHLLDPLLNDYLNHPNCYYKNNIFKEYKTFTHSFPIEEFDTDLKFDLIVMNNVLEHCYDVTIIFEKIYNMLNENGIFIFSDVFFKSEDVHRMVHIIYDSGHPIKLSEEYMISFLSKFETLYEKTLEKLYGQEWRLDKYFIGKKIIKQNNEII
jgi:2-polyprenyl-3-methyl-5-hydroxy-6-metoxy-1,4-benzoquinol methylase